VPSLVPLLRRYVKCILRDMKGADVRRLRRRLRLTQAELAARVGVHKLTVSRWESGRGGVPEPTARLLALLAATVPTPTRKRGRR